MREEITKALEAAGVGLPIDLKAKLKDDNIEKQAIDFYEKTKIEPPAQMQRTMQQYAAKKETDMILLKVLKKLGADEADILSARASEKMHLLAELRAHDALARMILKIGHSAGVVMTPETQPTSTKDVLKLGIALQQIYGSLFDKVTQNSAAHDTLKKSLEIANSTIEKLRKEVKELNDGYNEVKEVLSNRVEVIAGSEAEHFHICGYSDIEETSLQWITWKIKSGKSPVFNADSNYPILSKVVLKDYSPNTAKFETLEAAQEFIDWLSGRSLTRKIADPSSLQIARFVAESFGS